MDERRDVERRERSEAVDHHYFAKHAEEAREMAGQTTVPRSRELHLMLAAEYDAKATSAAAKLTGRPERTLRAASRMGTTSAVGAVFARWVLLWAGQGFENC
jgi:hypothetical protein